ncbi:ZZ-type zinc finger-containing protein 3 [Nephila pilipes]|uniref:ZZ-type zinc finger-containing protein 3 n=1 Tax=Nephila pilipes TaxID=299642 RepID=A0A8X6TEG9_NEPPI|nr:ZZ-type zinc finger-containing protein 3 [Nephila pilipes]
MEIESPNYFDSFDDIGCGSFNILSEETVLDSNNILNEETVLDSNNILNENEIRTESCETTQEMDYDSYGEFSFDSDHPALKNNNDYKELLKTVAILEAQRSRAIKDLDRLHDLKEEALTDPIAFVERLQQGEKIDFPSRQKIYPVPAIDWNKYALSGNSSLSRRQLTRLSSKATQDLFKTNFKDKSSRIHDSKPPKINHYWSTDEQKQLEELLVKFPPEDIESRRWEKIANCLENRTPVQVASRVQKYFIKLLKAGMPVPGRMPNMVYLKKPRRSVIRHQPSTFMVSNSLPVYMPDAEDEFNYSYLQLPTSEENSMESKTGVSDDELNQEFRGTSEYDELMLLKKVQKVKLQNCGLTQHIGFKCSHCKTEPIVGVRWHCTDCKPPASIDFCEDCADGFHEKGQHTSDHRLEEIHSIRTSFHDRDYTHFLSGYNKLDPNNVPAT